MAKVVCEGSRKNKGGPPPGLQACCNSCGAILETLENERWSNKQDKFATYGWLIECPACGSKEVFVKDPIRNGLGAGLWGSH